MSLTEARRRDSRCDFGLFDARIVRKITLCNNTVVAIHCVFRTNQNGKYLYGKSQFEKNFLMLAFK